MKALVTIISMLALNVSAGPIKESLIVVSQDNVTQNKFEDCVKFRRKNLIENEIHSSVKEGMIRNAACFCINRLKINAENSGSCIVTNKHGVKYVR